MRRRALASLLVTSFLHLLFATLATPGLADPAWLLPLDLSRAGGSAEAPAVAVDAAGDALAVWQRLNGTNTIIESAFRPAGAEWQPPLDLSLIGHNASKPQLVTDSAGSVAIWRRYDGSDYIVQSEFKPAGGIWQTPIDLSEAGQNADAPQVAMDLAGDAFAIWQRSNGTNTIIQCAFKPADGSWGAPFDLSKEGADTEAPPDRA